VYSHIRALAAVDPAMAAGKIGPVLRIWILVIMRSKPEFSERYSNAVVVDVALVSQV
jgi:hypothetical protein